MIIADTCEWSAPGANPYYGTAEAAVRAMAPLEVSMRARLLDRVRNLSAYDDVVFVDREAVRGKAHRYERDLIWLNSGDGRHVCAIATRDSWKPEAVETAIAFCVGAVCAVKFSVCGNWAIVTIRSEPPPAPVPPLLPFERPPLAATPPIEVVPPEVPPTAFIEAPPAEGVPPTWQAWWPPLPPAYGPCCVYVPPPLPIPSPVPEMPTWLLLAAGGVALSTWRGRKQWA